MGAKGISKRAPIGKRFGKVVVLSPPIPQGGHSQTVVCRCDCGDEREYFIGNLVKQREPMCSSCRDRCHPARGQSLRHPLFVTWKGIIQRCENPKHTFYHLYGARGIKMCKRWRDDFLAFAADVGERPQGMTIDRMRIDGNYEPGNVRWATQEEQMNNVRNNVHVEWRGRSLTVAQAAREAGLEIATFAYRLKAGWDIERIMNTPSARAANRGAHKPQRVA
jgi:hypothetical protein